MYFENIEKIDIEEWINPKYKILAHIKENKGQKKEETLKEHTDLCFKYFNTLIDKKRLQNIFKRVESVFIEEFAEEEKALFREMLLNIIIFHDIGKINPNFQKLVLKNDIKVNVKETNDSGHSLLSSIIYMDYFIKKINKPSITVESKVILMDFMFLNAYCVSRHHGGLNNFNEFVCKFSNCGLGITAGAGLNILEVRSLFDETGNVDLKITGEQIRRFIKIVKDNCKYTKEQIISRAAYERLMLSLIFAADFYATTEFMDDIQTKNFGNFIDFDIFARQYKEGEIYQSIEKYRKDVYENLDVNIDFENIKDVNVLRNELFLDSSKALKENIDKSIFYLEAPTGSGKSNVALNLSFELLEKDKTKNKIIYVYPFNTLVEQNIEIFKSSFGSKEIEDNVAVINSATPIKFKENGYENDEDILTYGDYNRKMNSEKDKINLYKQVLLNRQFLNYPLMLTTHVTLFKYLFGTEKENVFPMHQLANSVIVLDEIQSYKNAIWGEIISFLTAYADILNFKVIIMSATLPNLDDLSLLAENQGEKTVRLIEDRNKYFLNPIFKDRVNLDFSLLNVEDSKELEECLKEKVKYHASEGKKVLLEFIKKSRAEEFYKNLIDDEDIECDIDIITGDYSCAVRNEILSKVKEKNEPIILVSTQVVEAGVDIDMDIGFKNISLFDSEEQFLGRINRSGKKNNSKAYFFYLDSPALIYKGDLRKQPSLSLKEEAIQELLKNKDFKSYYKMVIEKLYGNSRKENDANIVEFFDIDVKLLNNYMIEKRMMLIDDVQDRATIFLNSRVKDKDGQLIDGKSVWDKYKVLLESYELEYAEKRVKLSDVRAKMGLFTYEVKFDELPPYNDRIGDLYFIEDGEQYLENDRFSRQKLKNGVFI